MRCVLHVVSSKDAAAVIADWEQEDKYYGQAMQIPTNRAARQATYRQAADTISESMIVVNLKTAVPLRQSIKVVYLDPLSDAGLPHTRGVRGIALPIFLLWNPRPSTIEHEIVHLSQKQFPDAWWSWYRDVWKFRPAKREESTAIPEHLRARRRINPDTLQNPYAVWQSRYIPMSVFMSDMAPDLRICKRGFWDLRTGQWTWEPPPGWVRMFGQGFNDEHPHEIAAHWIDGSAGEEKRQYFSLNPILQPAVPLDIKC